MQHIAALGRQRWFRFVVAAVSTLLRNALLPMVWLQALWNRSQWRTASGALGLAGIVSWIYSPASGL